jgi:PAS domain S-box-containing protein
VAASHLVDVIQINNVEDDAVEYVGDVDTLMGYEPGEFPRTLSGFMDQIHPEDRSRVDEELERILEASVASWKVEYRMRAADGTYRHWVDQGTVTEHTEDGRTRVGVGAIQDITHEVERERKLEQALQDLEAARTRLAAENIYLQEELKERLDYSEIVGASELWLHALSQVKLVASMDTTILLEGETGTGKELLARALHDGGPRSGRALIQVNCAALPSTLIESELFGHEKGAFSGALAMRRGRFELADGGTLLLDEIAELPLDLQAKLLHVLQEGEFERVGSSKVLKSDVRVIAATNRDLQQEVQTGRFRQDLFFRLAVFPIHLPPLRARPADVPLLVTYFLERQNRKHGKSIQRVSGSTMELLQTYDWPGNVRELENLVERGVILSTGEDLRIDAALLARSAGAPPPTVESSRPPAVESQSRSPGSESLQDVERAHILSVLEASAWKIKGRGNAADRLGLKENTLRYRMKKLGIQRPR